MLPHLHTAAWYSDCRSRVKPFHESWPFASNFTQVVSVLQSGHQLFGERTCRSVLTPEEGRDWEVESYPREVGLRSRVET